MGAGAAGVTAALAAAEAGAEVLLLERDDTPRGSTSMSQGNACAAGSRLQKEAGIDDTPEAFIADAIARTGGKANLELTRVIAHNSGAVIDWLVERHAIPFELNLTWGGFFGHSVNRIHGVPSKRGVELHGALLRAAEAAGVTLVTGAHVTRLHADADDRVVGVSFTRRDGATESVGAGAVILATCGFGANEEMVRRYIPDFGNSPVYRYFGHEGNEGDGIAWDIALGAALGSMDAFQGYGALADPHGIIMNYDMLMSGGIMVNAEGRRYSNEVADISAQSLDTLAQPGGIGWVVFDDKRRAEVEDLPEFADLAGLGAVRTAATEPELAGLIGVPAAALAETPEETRQLAAAGAGAPSAGISPRLRRLPGRCTRSGSPARSSTRRAA